MMPKTVAKPQAKKKATAKPVPKKKATKQTPHKKEAPHKPPQRRSKAMSETPQVQAQQQQPRGAGSGQKATETRERNLVDWPPEPVSHQEKVDELETEADAQAQYNAEMNELQTEDQKRINEARLKALTDPINADEAREEARKQYAASTDPKAKEAAIKGEMDARAKRDKAAAEKK